ncbi:unnamed protein product, partial [Prunus brigantina]
MPLLVCSCCGRCCLCLLRFPLMWSLSLLLLWPCPLPLLLPYLLPCSQGFCVLLCALFFRVCSCVSAANFALVCHLFHSWLTKRPSL